MAIVLMESMGFTSAAILQSDGWSTSNGISGTSRFDHNSLWVINGTAAKPLGASYSELILSVAVYIINLASDDTYIHFRNGAGSIGELRVVTSGGQKFFRLASGGGTIWGTGTTPLAANVWYHLQFRYKLSATIGEAELRVNGAATAEINATGLNTGTTNIDTIAFITGQNQSMYVSDVVVQDTSGGAPWNTFLGETRFVLPLPTGNSATNNAWTANTGTKFGAVDEIQDNGDTDYISDATPGDRQTFTNATISVPTTSVFAVQVSNIARKDDATPRTIATVVRQGSTNYDGTPSAGLSTTYLRYKQIYQQGPDGSNWDITRVNAAEFGVKMVS